MFVICLWKKPEVPVGISLSEKDAIEIVYQLKTENKPAFYQEVDLELLSFLYHQENLEDKEIFDLGRFL